MSINVVTACKLKIYEKLIMKKINEALEAATFRWYSEEAKKQGLNIDKDEARELIYGMPYEKWKGKFQLERNSLDIEKIMKKNEESNSD